MVWSHPPGDFFKEFATEIAIITENGLWN